jgi:integrase
MSETSKRRAELERGLANELYKRFRELSRIARKVDDLAKWRESCLLSISDNLKVLKEYIEKESKKNKDTAQPPKLITTRKRKTKQPQKKETSDSVKLAFRIAWYKLRKNMNMMHQQTTVFMMVYLASHETLLGQNECWKIGLQYNRERKYAMKLDSALNIGLDIYVKFREKVFCNTYRIAGRFENSSENKSKQIVSFGKLEASAQIAIALLCEGMHLKEIIKIKPEHFIYLNNTAALFIPMGKSYRIVPLRFETTVLIQARLKKLGDWYNAYQKGKTVELEKAFPNFTNRVRSILRETSEELGLKEEPIDVETLRNTALLDRYVQSDVMPASLASVFGPECIYNVVAPRSLFKGYQPSVAKRMPSQAPESIEIEINSTLESVNILQEIVVKYLNGETREKTLELVKNVEKCEPGNTMVKFCEYIINLKVKGTRYADPDTVLKYFVTIKSLFVDGVLRGESGSIDEEELLKYLVGEGREDSDKPLLIENRLFRDTRTAVNHFQQMMKKQGSPVKEVKWQKFQKFIEHSCRLIVVPDIIETEKVISGLLKENDPELRDFGLYMLLIAFLGLRKSEAINITVKKIVQLGKGVDGAIEDYVEVTGKGKKDRPVPLGFLKENLKYLYSYLDNKLKNSEQRLFLPEYEKKFQNYFNKYFKDIAPSGPHTYRHAFTQRCVERYTNASELSALLGHETLRVVHNNYDMSSFKLLCEKMENPYLTKTILTQKELSPFLQLTKDQVVSLKKKIKHEHREKVARKLNESSYIFNTKDLVDMYMKSYIDRVSRVSMKLKESIWERYYKKGKKRGRYVAKKDKKKTES